MTHTGGACNSRLKLCVRKFRVGIHEMPKFGLKNLKRVSYRNIFQMWSGNSWDGDLERAMWCPVVLLITVKSLLYITYTYM